jgi:hypothetical protein
VAALLAVWAIFFGSDVLANPLDDLLAERQHITSGTFNGFAIGEGKLDAYHQAAKMNVYGIEVLPNANERVKFDNSAQLNHFDPSDGIRVTNYRNVTFDLYFDKNKLKETKVIGAPAGGLSNLQPGDSFESILSKLRSMLQLDHTLIAYSFATESRFHTLRDVRPSDLSGLLARDRWHFEVQSDGPSGSMYDLRFVSGHLVEIEYFRSRIRK